MTSMTNLLNKMRGKWGGYFDRAVLAILVYGAWWMIQSTGTLLIRSSVTDTKIENLDIKIEAMYRSSDAKRDVADITRRIDFNDKRINSIESRVQELERR